MRIIAKLLVTLCITTFLIRSELGFAIIFTQAIFDFADREEIGSIASQITSNDHYFAAWFEEF